MQFKSLLLMCDRRHLTPSMPQEYEDLQRVAAEKQALDMKLEAQVIGVVEIADDQASRGHQSVPSNGVGAKPLCF